ncbi:hypothetical protein COOONC_10657 [Cooperia oncophora]
MVTNGQRADASRAEALRFSAKKGSRYRRNSRRGEEYEADRYHGRSDYCDSIRDSEERYRYDERDDGSEMCNRCRFGTWPSCSCRKTKRKGNGWRDHRERESSAERYERAAMESEDERYPPRCRDRRSPERLTREEWRRLERE